MKIDDFLKHIENEHRPENIGDDDEIYDYAGEHQEFDEGATLQQFRDCFREDIE